MILSTTFDVPGRTIAQNLGVFHAGFVAARYFLKLRLEVYVSLSACKQFQRPGDRQARLVLVRRFSGLVERLTLRARSALALAAGRGGRWRQL